MVFDANSPAQPNLSFVTFEKHFKVSLAIETREVLMFAQKC